MPLGIPPFLVVVWCSYYTTFGISCALFFTVALVIVIHRPHEARFWLRGVEFDLLDGFERY